jgi:stage IV sporulation protein FB
MLLGEPQHSQYDWRFQILGFPVRVTWLFWAISAALGYSWAQSFQWTYAAMGVQINLSLFLLAWVGVTFVSILIHELGHSLAFRYYGIESEIVLYQMGGLAIPGAGLAWSRMGKRRNLTHLNQIVISAAGPAIQLLLAAIVGILAVLCGVYVPEFAWLGNALGIELSPQRTIAYASIRFMVTASIWWAVINLIPIYPLDGGQIAQHVIGIFRRNSGLTEVHMLSIVVAGAAAFWFMSRGSTLNGLFFASLAMNNFQMLQATNGPRIW